MSDKEKSAGILDGLRTFLTQYNANLCLFSGITSLRGVAQRGAFYLGPRAKKDRLTTVFFFGAGDEARTRYLHLGKVALYRMSYTREQDVL